MSKIMELAERWRCAGGHYEAEHGRDKAVQDADIKVANLTVQSDEIAALREEIAAQRQRALDDAAEVCEETTGAWIEGDYNAGCIDCSRAIRALKEKA